MSKRVLALILALTLLTALLAGCGKDGSSDLGELPEDDESQTITISYWMYPDDYRYYNSLTDNPVVKVLDQMFNVKLEFQTPAKGSEADNFQLMLGTQDYTDIMNMTYCTESLGTLYEDGVILDLAPYIDEYMPNYKALIESNEALKRAVYDDDGHLFSLVTMDNPGRTQWGGMVYRRDILETMTGGNVAFPSGNAEPTTVEDWDYMLPLMKQYFEATGMQDTACLILPAVGYMATGELQAGWGVGPTIGLATDGKTVTFAPAEDSFYNYLAKMHEWYEAGYVYQDFASRTNDLFYLPNTALTYGGAAGVWFGLLGQLSDRMSLPEYGLNMDVRPLSAPLDTANGVTAADAASFVSVDVIAENRCVAASVDPAKLPRILKLMDYLYTQEGALLMNRGLNAEQAANDDLYKEMGYTDGAYWFDENGDICVAQWVIDANVLGIEPMSFTGQRIQGKRDDTELDWPANKERTYLDDAEDNADAVWTMYGDARVIPNSAAQMTPEESEKFNAVFTAVNDYVNTMVPKFIIGTEPLNADSWKAYLDQLNALGLQDILDARQSAYDRYLAR